MIVWCYDDNMFSTHTQKTFYTILRKERIKETSNSNKRHFILSKHPIVESPKSQRQRSRRHPTIEGLWKPKNGANIEFYPGFLSKIQNSRAWVFIFFKLVSFEFWILRDNWINILLIFFHQMRYIRTTKKRTPYAKRYLALSSVERMDIKQIERCLNYFY